MKLKAPFDFQTIIFFTLLFVITVSFGYLLQPFFFSLFWAFSVDFSFHTWRNRPFQHFRFCPGAADSFLLSGHLGFIYKTLQG